jgi:predicted secreted protein
LKVVASAHCFYVRPAGSGSHRVAGWLSRLRPMDRRLARRNLRTALITSVIGLLMFALTFVAALLYVA